VRTAFAVLHSETSEQVAVDMDYHRAMFDLSQRVNSKESIVGWCGVLLRTGKKDLTRT
jgi:translation initiation factor 3 subunit F